MNKSRRTLRNTQRRLAIGIASLSLIVFQATGSFAQTAGSRHKGRVTPRPDVSHIDIPSLPSIDADALEAMAGSLNALPAIQAQTAAVKAGFDLKMAQLAPPMEKLSHMRFELEGMGEAPMELAQSAADLAEMSAGFAPLAATAPMAMMEARDAVALAQESSPAAKAYEKAYNLVLSKKWTEAQKEFDDFIGKYRKSSYIDGANYWKCYVREKLGDPSESVFKAYQSFVKSYPRSRWADDAKTNMVRIGSELVRQGKSEYAPTVESMQEGDDEDVKLTALYALRGNADEKSLPVIMNLYDQSKSEKLRGRIVYVLGSFDSPSVVPKLAEIAMKDPSMSVRKNAVYALGNTNKSEAGNALKKIVKSQADPEIRTTAIYSLANLGAEGLIPYLADVAKTESDDKLARTATYAIANVNSEESSKALESILKNAKSKEVRKAALHSLGNRGDATAVATLKDIALNEPDSDMKRTAAYALGNIHSAASLDALKAVLASSADTRSKEAALQAIGMMGSSEARDILKKFALSDQDDRLARMAVYALGSSPRDGEGVDGKFYMDLLRNAKSLEVKKAALYQYANASGSDAAKMLGQFVKDEKDDELKIAAIYVLGNTRSDDAVNVLLEIAQKDGNKRDRTAAVSALSNIGSKKAQDALLQILEGKTKE